MHELRKIYSKSKAIEIVRGKLFQIPGESGDLTLSKDC